MPWVYLKLSPIWSECAHTTRPSDSEPAGLHHPLDVADDVRQGDRRDAVVVDELVALRGLLHDVAAGLLLAQVRLDPEGEHAVGGHVLPGVHAEDVLWLGLEDHAPDLAPVERHQREVVPSAGLAVTAQNGGTGPDRVAEDPVPYQRLAQRAVRENEHLRSHRIPWRPRCTRCIRRP